MTLENENKPAYRSGFVAIIGKPNTGKSTLLNHLLGQLLAGVSARPQTTRKRQLGILTHEHAQIIFVDTPGLHDAKDKLGQLINSEALMAIRDADVLVFLADCSNAPDREDESLAQAVAQVQADIPVVLALNKCDVVGPRAFGENKTAFVTLLPSVPVFEISAKNGTGVSALLSHVEGLLPEGPQYYPEDQITDEYEREIASEMIRAACMSNLQDEVPYSIAVRVDEFSEREEDLCYIKATIFVEREAQKGIVIGKGGTMIKQIGSDARLKIEEMGNRKVYLELGVKVQKGWKEDQAFLRQIGLLKGDK